MKEDRKNAEPGDDQVRACLAEAEEFIKDVIEGRIKPMQIVIAFSEVAPDGSSSFGIHNTAGDAFQHQGLLYTALAHITSQLLGGHGLTH